MPSATPVDTWSLARTSAPRVRLTLLLVVFGELSLASKRWRA
jgi:hypothetical protein